MSDGRTYWWAKDQAWYDRDAVSWVGIHHHSLGLTALDWLCCHAKALNDGGRVKSGYAAVAKGICEGDDYDAVMDAIRCAAENGALDDFEEGHHGTFTCRISGWASDQESALKQGRNLRQRETARVAVSRRESPVSRRESVRVEEQEQEQEQESS